MAFPHWIPCLFLAALSFLIVPQRSQALTELTESQQLHVYGKAGDGVDITILQGVAKAGAVCLDGSAPAYHLRRGFGSGAKNWHIRLEGGGWCESISACSDRAKTNYGSSKLMSNQILFNGILNNRYSINPDFYNWNHVYVRYCDGGSFTADVPAPVKSYSGQLLYFRGLRIFRSVMNDLKSKGLGSASQALLTGCSAGGLAVVHRCNEFKSVLPGVGVKCLSDAGFFINGPSVTGSYAFYNYLKSVVTFQKLQYTLSKSCTGANDATQCFFPAQAQGYVQPPMFFVNSAFDYWQLENVKQLSWSQYSPCMKSSSCSQEKTIEGFRQTMLNSLTYSKSRAGWGSFIDSCFNHCQVETDNKWTNPRIGGKSLAHAVGDWYFGRAVGHHTDCGVSTTCNPTCVAYPLATGLHS